MRNMTRWLVIIGLLGTMLVGPNAHANLLKNGSFQSGDFSNWTIYFNGNDFSTASVSPSSDFGASSAYAAVLFPSSNAILDLSQNVRTGSHVEYLISFEVESFGLFGSPGPNGGHVTVG